MDLDKRIQRIEEKLRPLLEVQRPVVKIHFKEDKNAKLRELKAKYGEDYDPKIELSFEGASVEELKYFVFGRNNPTKYDFEDWSYQEKLDYCMGRGTRKPKVLIDEKG